MTMKRTSLSIVALLLLMSLSTGIAQIVSPNDTVTSGGTTITLSIDGYVPTKFASIGGEVEVHALTRGHSSATIVTADILRYPGVDPISIMTNARLPTNGIVLDTIALVQAGVHEEDSDTMTWQGTYTIPVGTMGGLFGASVTAQDGNMRVTDDNVQLRQLIEGKFEVVLAGIDDAWDEANPLGEMKAEFEELDSLAEDGGGWPQFVTDASKGGGTGGSAQLWQAMIDAGRDDYDMEAGANFLEALMELCDSEDVDAGMALAIGLLVYGDEFPLPRTMDDFDEVVEYIQKVDPIQNFTRFEGTGDFEAAYNALVGSNEWASIRSALDDIANGTREFAAIQTIMRNIALLTISAHPKAIADALEAWIEPLAEGDVGNMTPVQKMLVRWAQMAEEIDKETDVIDSNGDEVPDRIIWEYEKLMQTAEGQAWRAKMNVSSPYVNDVFADFDMLPEDLLAHGFDAVNHSAWDTAGGIVMDFAYWLENASGIHRSHEYRPSDDSDDGDEGEEGNDEDSIIFSELHQIRTTRFDPNVLDMGIEIGIWGPSASSAYPPSFDVQMTNNHGVTVSSSVVQVFNDQHTYRGRITASNIENAIWTFEQPLEDYAYASEVDRAKLEFESLRPSMLEMLGVELNDESFVVSALGVLVKQEETVRNSTSYTVDSVTYDGSGAVSGAEVDIAIVRVSPQQGEVAAAQLSPEGEVEVTIDSDSITAVYSGSDLVGSLDGRISRYDDDENRQGVNVADIDGEIEITGTGNQWRATTALPNETGIVWLTSTGENYDGLEFRFMQPAILPGTPGCAHTRGNQQGQAHESNLVSIDWKHTQFRMENEEGGPGDDLDDDHPELMQAWIDWGDGQKAEVSDAGNLTDGSQWHDYGSDQMERNITVSYQDEKGWTNHSLPYQPGLGFFDSDGEPAQSTGRGRCELPGVETAHIPSPEIIDSFLTTGPLEVMTETILTSDENGGASLTFQPTLPGVYVSIVQSKVTLPGVGNHLTGVGFNVVLATEGTLSIEGPTLISHFAGLPIYSVAPDSGGLTSISVVAEQMPEDEFNAKLVIVPLNMSEAFPSAPEDAFRNFDAEGEKEEQEYDLEFESGDLRRTQEVRIRAPISLILVAEDSESLFPKAVHLGLILNQPQDLAFNGTLGPGQTTNVALADENASRILAVASPEQGVDPASVDLSTFTELIYGEAAREEIGWIASERKLERICEQVEARHEESWDGAEMESNVVIEIHRYSNRFLPNAPLPDTSNTVLTDEHGTVISPQDDWKESNGRMRAEFLVAKGVNHTLMTSTMYETTGIFRLNQEHGYMEWHESEERCSDETWDSLNETEEFALLDDLLSDLGSVAWGQGSSADLRLPVLASPIEEYTVLAVAQIGGEGSSSLVAAIGSQESQPNPEPPRMQNLTVSFSPSNPRPTDTVVITALDESSQPVEGLSVTLMRGEDRLFGQITDQDGQASFQIETGTLMFRVSGGMYYPTQIILLVSDAGTSTEGGEVLPADSDGDGTLDQDDAFPNDPDENKDTDGDGVGDNEDAFPNDANETKDSDGDGIGDNAELANEAAESMSLPMMSMLIAAVVVIVILLAGAGLLFMRKRDDSDYDDYASDAMWSDGGGKTRTDPIPMGPPSSAPGGGVPPSTMRGQMRDGYEVVEYPQNSGSWWWRDPNSGQWNEWQ